MPLSLRYFFRVLPALRGTLNRFPLPVLCTVLASGVAMVLSHRFFPDHKFLLTRLFVASSFCAVGLTSLRLFGESRDWSLAKHWVGSALLITAVGGYVWFVFDPNLPWGHFFFALALGLSVLIAPYINRPGDTASVWYFNYQTGSGVFFAGIGAVVLGTGISLSLVSIKYLFGIKIPGNIYGDVWIFCWGVFAPVYALASLSRQFVFDDESCEFPKGVSFIVNYLLVPLMFVYLTILYIYFAKIVFQWELPRGNLGWMVIGFGTVGIVTKLLAYPIRQKGNILLTLFDRYYYYALIVPILLLGVAIGVRVKEYGVTEERYAVVLLGAWFVLVVMAALRKQDRLNIKYVPMVLALMAVLASFGPWGAVQISLSSQLSRFESLLTKYGLLVEGEAVRVKVSIPFAERKSMSSIADYLSRTESRLQRIRPWFAELAKETERKDFVASRWGAGGELMAALGVNYVNRWEKEGDGDTERFSYRLSRGMRQTAGFRYVARGDVWPGSETSKEVHGSGDDFDLIVECNYSQLVVRTRQGEKVVFDLVGHIRKLQQQPKSIFMLSDERKMTLTGTSAAGKFKARLVLENLGGNYDKDGKPKLYHVQYLLLATPLNR